MRGPHDRGGWPGAGPIDRTEHQLADWELLGEALTMAIGAKQIRCTDESRRARESLPLEVYESMAYYERWIAATEINLIERGILTAEEIDRRVAELQQEGA
jgi:hypothetical protein